MRNAVLFIEKPDTIPRRFFSYWSESSLFFSIGSVIMPSFCAYYLEAENASRNEGTS